MARIIVERSMSCAGRTTYKRGEVAEVDDALAEAWVRSGVASWHEPKPRRKREPKVEQED